MSLLSAFIHQQAGSALLLSAVGIAFVCVSLDLFYAHPIPHGGVSLHWNMWSDVPADEQALAPMLSMVVAVAMMGLAFVSHRQLVAVSESEASSTREEKGGEVQPSSPSSPRKVLTVGELAMQRAASLTGGGSPKKQD